MKQNIARIFVASSAVGVALLALVGCDAYTPSASDPATQIGKPSTGSLLGSKSEPAPPLTQADQIAIAGTGPDNCPPAVAAAAKPSVTGSLTPPAAQPAAPVIAAATNCEAAYQQGYADGSRAVRAQAQPGAPSPTQVAYGSGTRRLAAPHRHVVRHVAPAKPVRKVAAAPAPRPVTRPAPRPQYAERPTYQASGDTRYCCVPIQQAPVIVQQAPVYVPVPARPAVVVQRRCCEETRYSAPMISQPNYHTHGGYGYAPPAPVYRPAPQAQAPAPVYRPQPVAVAPAHPPQAVRSQGYVGTYAHGAYYAPQGQARACCLASTGGHPGAVYQAAGRDAGGYLTFAGKPR